MTAPPAARRPAWHLAAPVFVSLVASVLVGALRHERLWFVDEETYFGHGARILETRSIGSQVDNWHPPLAFLVQGLPLVLHPLTPDLSGAVPDDPALPAGLAPEAGRKNPVLHDSVAWYLRDAVDRAGGSFAAYAFWSRLPMVLLGLVWLFIAWRLLEALGADPLPGTCLLGLSHGFVLDEPRILTDALFAGLVLASSAAAFALARRPGWRTSLLLGIVVGLPFGTKTSALAALAASLPAALLFHAGLQESSGDAVGGHAGGASWRWRGALAGMPRLLGAWALSLPIAFVTLWAVYGFQVRSLAETDHLHRRLATTPAHFVEAHPRLASVPIPMPSFLETFRNNQVLVAGCDYARVDFVSHASLTRRVFYYVTRGAVHVGPPLIALALLAALFVAARPGARFHALALAMPGCAYASATWLNGLALWGRHAGPFQVGAALIAGLAWLPGAPGWLVRSRRALLVAQLAYAALQVGLFFATSGPARTPSSPDSLFGFD